MKPDPDWRHETVKLIQLASKDERILDALLEDLLTPQELVAVCQRWQIIKKIYRGFPHRDITDELKVAIATITRGSRMLRNKAGGFHHLIHMILTIKNPNGLVKAWRKELKEPFPG